VGGGDAGVIRLAIRVARADADLVLAELTELAPAGLEERDVGPDTVEYAIYGAPGELPAMPDVRAAAGGALVEVSTTELPDDWDVRWRTWHPAVVVEGGGRAVRIRPPWEEPRPGTIDVAIEPAQAFGTGAHETTRLCLALLLETPAAGPLADWGCGSGVLAVAAAKLGFAPVTACDVEAASVAATEDAALANGVELEVTRCDLRRAPGPYAPTVTANLIRPLLLEVAANLERAPDTLIASGLLRHEADEVAVAFAETGLHETARREGGEWAALLLRTRP
jgi:ribosomal protein L11 methyltransferase